MKNKKNIVLFTGIYAVTGVIITALMAYLFKSCEFFRSLFFDTITPAGAVTDQTDPEQIAAAARAATESAANISFGVMLFILLLQVFAFLTALLVFRGLARSTEAIQIRMRRLDNADLFLDLPLYFGLFGTVSSFVIMSFNPQISRLLAYSSTLIGIIFSVILRLTMQYPLRQRFIAELPVSEKGDVK